MTGDFLLDLKARQPGGCSVLFADHGISLRAMLTSAGYDRCQDPAYDWHGARRGSSAFALLQHTISGGGWLRHQGACRAVQPGQTMLLRFPDNNRYWLGRNPEWEFFWICLNGREALRIWSTLMAVQGPLVWLRPATIDALAGLCRRVLDGEAATAPAASAIAYSVTMALLEDIWPRPASPTAATSPAIARVQAICRARLSDPVLDVQALAEGAGYSRPHFTRVFADAVGVPPARYLQQLRMERAARLLVEGSSPIKQVAAQCGFTEANYFAKAFRKHFGIAPSEVQRSGAFSEREPRPPLERPARPHREPITKRGQLA